MTPARLTWEKSTDLKQSRLIFHLDRNSRYTYFKESAGRRTKRPARLIIEFPHTGLQSGLNKKVPIKSRWASKIKFKEGLLSGGLRASIDLKPGAKYTVKRSGYNVIVDFGRPKKSKTPVVASKTPSKKKYTRRAVERPVKIMIDPGHGGKDPGAVGPKGTKEKDLVLSVGKQLARFLKRNMNAKVKLTRWRDKYLTLEQRNKMAEAWGADVFISLHVNASENKEMRGVETYFLNNSTSRASVKLAKRENKNSGRPLKDIEKIVLTMLQNYSAEESKLLARSVQGSLVDRMSDNYGKVGDKGIKGALFYVLVGAKCPGILVEMSFVSNPLEEKRLRLRHYQSHLALGIAEGVKGYISKHPPE